MTTDVALIHDAMKIGFTGTRRGMTQAQKMVLKDLLIQSHAQWLLHGDCVGADEEAHALALAAGIFVEIHPPIEPKHRAFLEPSAMHEPRPYLDRNHDIVEACDVLIAAPFGPERLRSGTWATVRYARKIGKPVVIIRTPRHLTKSRIVGMSGRLTPPQVYALALLGSADPRYEGEGVVTSDESRMVDNQAWIHWRTAEALQRRGLAYIVSHGPDGASIFCTDPLTNEEGGE